MISTQIVSAITPCHVAQAARVGRFPYSHAADNSTHLSAIELASAFPTY